MSHQDIKCMIEAACEDYFISQHAHALMEDLAKALEEDPHNVLAEADTTTKGERP